MKCQEVLNCTLPVWYSNFDQLTVRTILLKLPRSFVSYLTSGDGLYLPSELSSDRSSSEADAILESEDGQEDNNETLKLFNKPDFQDFHADVNHAIEELGGKVFPKLNWSSPKDAAWIAMNNSLCCQSFIDICLLLKSSDFVTHDLTQPFKACVDANDEHPVDVEYTLALREWRDISPSGEYRCFVKDQKLIAISQRHQQYFKFIESSKEKIVKKIHKFAKKNLINKFSDIAFVFDVYISGSSILLIDFNPYGETTDTILFSWGELNSNSSQSDECTSVIDGVMFRYVSSEAMAGANDIRMYAFPVDFQHLSSGEDPAKLIDLMKLHDNIQRTDETSDSDS